MTWIHALEVVAAFLIAGLLLNVLRAWQIRARAREARELADTRARLDELLRRRDFIRSRFQSVQVLFRQYREQRRFLSEQVERLWPEKVAFERGDASFSELLKATHADAEIVDCLQAAYRALEDSYFRDVEILRSGERWSPALLEKIREADVFQLCWSEAARASAFVEQEWRHALHLERECFVRPMYWREPLPAPPAELADLHFAYVVMAPAAGSVPNPM